MTRDALVVWGMHRSGTSALSRVLSLAGAAMPTDLMKPQADNPTGFWESVRVAQTNESILASLGRSWSDPRPIPADIAGEILAAANAEAARLLAEHWPAEGPIVVKDPRMSRLGQVWLPALRNAGFSPSLILSLRHPEEVAGSLQARNGFSPTHSRLLWLTYTLEAWACEEAPRAIVRYTDLLSDWRAVLRRLRASLGLALPVSDAAAREIDLFLSPDLRHHARDEIPANGADEDLAARLYRMLDRAAAGDAADPRREFDIHRASWRLFAPVWENGMAGNGSPSARHESGGAVLREDRRIAGAASSGREARPRPLVLHYHLFKNAGTSLDRTLRANFGATWDAYEGERRELRPAELREYLAGRPWIAALSSHKALLPAPDLPGVEVIPVIFLRHPLDRIRSIYEFERRQQADTDGALAAKRLDLPGYVSWRLDRKGDRAIADFQTYRLAQGGAGPDEAAQALDAVATLPFVGLVEAYDVSLQRLQALLAPHFPRINLAVFHVNVTEGERVPMDERLAQLEARLGEELYDRTVEANQLDLAVWRKVSETYESAQG